MSTQPSWDPSILSSDAVGAFTDDLRVFAEELTANYASFTRAQPEDQLKGPVQVLVKRAAERLGIGPLVTRTEVRVSGVAGRPDIGVDKQGIAVGNVELKAPGKGARPEAFASKADRAQWERFTKLPNLVYTDSRAWALYRLGEPTGAVLELSFDPTKDGAASVTEGDARQLLGLLGQFLDWQPVVPAHPRGLAEVLAPLTRLLREEVLADVKARGPLDSLFKEWQSSLFPDADKASFADSYAQTFTYALLLAKLEGAPSPLTADSAASALAPDHALLAEVLRLLADPRARAAIGMPAGLLERVIDAVDPVAVVARRDPWLYFYEDFLAAYDPAMRGNRGVYYTPIEVVEMQVRLADHALKTRLGLASGLADDSVTLLDPATGTGTYPLAVIDHVTRSVTERLGEGARGEAAEGLAARLMAFELLVGPYAVAHLRVTRALTAAGASSAATTHVYLTDALAAPAEEHLSGQLSFFVQELAAEQERASHVKAHTPVVCCLGNPPYDRDTSGGRQDEERKGGLVRHGHPAINGGRPLMEDLLAPLRDAGLGRYAQVLYNDYVYFWRFGIWKTTEQRELDDPGAPGGAVLTYITASSYVTGKAFGGLRQLMRRNFDEVWVINLGGEGRGARKDPNIFTIQTPVAVAVLVRYPEHDDETPARVFYTRVTGTAPEKLDHLGELVDLDPDSDRWRRASDGWMDQFTPPGESEFATWPQVTDVFPWTFTGCQYYRSWPIGETPEVLGRRWELLAGSPVDDRGELLKESRGRKATGVYRDVLTNAVMPSISELASGAPVVAPQRYALRTFDRHYVLPDNRVGDFIRPWLWGLHSDRQLYLTTISTPGNPLGAGPAVVATPYVPEAHVFCGRADKSLMARWRDRDGTIANIHPGVLAALSEAHGSDRGAEDVLAYVYGLMATGAYTERFADDLADDVPRVPFTKDPALFDEVCALGRELLWWHTWGEQFHTGHGGDRPQRNLPSGTARADVAVGNTPETYPEDYSYDEETQTLSVGTGRVSGVAPEVYSFEVSGMRVVSSWLGYRMKSRAGKKSSALDEVRPDRWSFTGELLTVLSLIEFTLAAEVRARPLLDAVVAAPLLREAELGAVPPELREVPAALADEEGEGTLDLGLE